jgi:hypothetical protein
MHTSQKRALTQTVEELEREKALLVSDAAQKLIDHETATTAQVAILNHRVNELNNFKIYYLVSNAFLFKQNKLIKVEISKCNDTILNLNNKLNN